MLTYTIYTYPTHSPRYIPLHPLSRQLLSVYFTYPYPFTPLHPLCRILIPPKFILPHPTTGQAGPAGCGEWIIYGGTWRHGAYPSHATHPSTTTAGDHLTSPSYLSLCHPHIYPPCTPVLQYSCHPLIHLLFLFHTSINNNHHNHNNNNHNR